MMGAMLENGRHMETGFRILETQIPTLRRRMPVVNEMGPVDRVDMLWRRLEAHDPETALHCQRTMELAASLGSEFGINPADMKIWSRLHDVGKVKIPTELLNKGGGLSPDERRMIEMHTLYGFLFLVREGLDETAAMVALHHHEKWNGTGYPHKLKGKEIPLPARVMFVADVWDALTFNRSYREAWPEQRALKYLVDNAGSQFDPGVVEAFLSMGWAAGPVSAAMD